LRGGKTRDTATSPRSYQISIIDNHRGITLFCVRSIWPSFSDRQKQSGLL